MRELVKEEQAILHVDIGFFPVQRPHFNEISA
jgi:hypothetical protein